MFRFFALDDEQKELRIFLEKIASRTIVNGLWDIYDPGLDHLEGRDYDPVRDADLFCGLIRPYFPENFFDGVGRFFGMSNDIAAGSWFMRKKISRMVEKLEDDEEEYRFDLFEQLLFSVAIRYACASVDGGFSPEERYFNEEGYKTAVKTLRNQFGYQKGAAKELAGQVTRFCEMIPKDGEENLFFLDEDAELMFKDGFIEGVDHIRSYGGETLGYGYGYACRIFTDAGLQPPILLVGTVETNEIVRAVEKERMMAKLNQFYSMVSKNHAGDDEKEEEHPAD